MTEPAQHPLLPPLPHRPLRVPPRPGADFEPTGNDASEPDLVLPQRFAAAPLQRLLAREMCRRHIGLEQLAGELHLSLRRLQHILGQRNLHAATADTLAIALGHHPGELWPEWFGVPAVPRRSTPTPRRGRS
ncbi:MAG: hypothetical protein ACYDB7_00050 [Mycobacteriales bacterium]